MSCVKSLAILGIWVVTAVVPVYAVEEVQTTVEQLEVLANREEWAEMVLRLGDVPAGARDSRWEKLVERGAMAYLRTLGQEGMSGSDGPADEMLRRFPSLRRSPDFLSYRRALVLQAYGQCADITPDAEECTERLFKSLQEDRLDTDGILKGAEAVAQHQSVCAALPFVELAVQEAVRIPTCQRRDVQKLILEGLALPPGPSQELASRLAGDRCWPWMKSRLPREVATSRSSHFRRAACAVLTAHKTPTALCPAKKSAAKR